MGIQVKVFLTLHKNKCGYSLEVPQQGNSNECPQHVFMEKKEKNQCFWLEIRSLSRAMINRDSNDKSIQVYSGEVSTG